MRASLIASLLLLLAMADAVDAQVDTPPAPGRQVITAATLRASGIRRLGEIFQLIDGWDAASVQGFTYAASPRGLSSYGRQAWIVMLDGQAADLTLFGVRSLDRLPLNLESLDSVTVLSVPGLHNGAFVDAGVIHLHSRRPAPGLAVQARATSASETGDPGPYRFTERASPNIDRIGSLAGGGLSFGGRGAFFDATARWQEHFVTDPPIRTRNLDISTAEYPIIKQSAASLSGGLRLERSRHTLQLGGSSTRDYYFLKAFGREVPVDSDLARIGLDGDFELGPTTSLTYRIDYSRNSLADHPNSLDLDYDWTLASLRADVEARRHTDSYTARLGLGLRRSLATTGYALSDDSFTLLASYGSLSFKLGDANDQTLTAHLTAGSDDLALRLALGHRWRPSARHTIDAVLAFVERLPEEDDRILYWHERGYGFLPDAGVTVSAAALDKARTASLDLFWSARLRENLRVRAGAYLRSHSRLALEAQPYGFDPASGSFSGPLTVTAGQSGQLAGWEVGTDWNATPNLQLRAHYRFQDVVDGDRLFEDAWRVVPRQVLRVSALHAPWPSVDLWGSLRYRGSSRWADYADVAEQSAGAYRHRVSDALMLDLAVQKWIWQRRLRMHVRLSNVFNDDVPSHPIGAAYGLSLLVQGELRAGARAQPASIARK